MPHLIALLFLSSASAQDVVNRAKAIQNLPNCSMLEITPGECLDLAGDMCGEVEFPQNAGAFVPTTPKCPNGIFVGKQDGPTFVHTAIDLGNGELKDAMIGEAGIRTKYYAVQLTSDTRIFRGDWYATDGTLIDTGGNLMVAIVPESAQPSVKSCKSGPIRYNELTATIRCDMNKEK